MYKAVQDQRILHLSRLLTWLLTCRVSARAELSLRQRLSQREERIAELKDMLASLQHGRQHATSDHHGATLCSSPRGPYHSTHHHGLPPQLRTEAPLAAQHSQHPAHTLSPRQHHSGAQLAAVNPTATAASHPQHSHNAQPSDGHQQTGVRAAVQVLVPRLPYFQQKSHQGSADSQATAGTDGQAVKGVQDRDLQNTSPHPATGRDIMLHISMDHRQLQQAIA